LQVLYTLLSTFGITPSVSPLGVTYPVHTLHLWWTVCKEGGKAFAFGIPLRGQP
jgi:hypothetical protein